MASWWSKARGAVGAIKTVVLAVGISSAAQAQILAPTTGGNPEQIFRAAPKPPGQRFYTETIKALFPGATPESIRPTATKPPAYEVRINGELKGYLFSTLDIVNATGYAGRPFDLVGGLTLDGKLTGAIVEAHYETIIGRGVPRQRVDEFMAGFATATIQRWGSVNPDILSGASISGRAFKAGIQNAALKVYAAHIQGEVEAEVTEPTLDRKGFSPRTVDDLLASGAIKGVTLTVQDAIALFEKAAGKGAKPDLNNQQMQQLDGLFIDFKTALLTPAAIGQNMFGDLRYREIMAKEPANGVSIWMADKGFQSFMSNSHLRSSENYMFDQVKIVQDKKEFRFSRDQFSRMLVANAFANEKLPTRESNVYSLAKDAGPDPLKPYTVVLMLPGFNAAGNPIKVDVPVTYAVPEEFVLMPPPVFVPAWIEIWRDSTVDVAILAALLTVVTLVFLLQDQLAKNRTAYNFVRVGTLAFTLGWLGWWVGGQYSIINIISYLQAPLHGTGIETFLLDPIFLILTVYIAITLFVLGRGVFCGWLCPFGALQELSNKAALLLRVPQIKVPRQLQERLWAVKYILAAIIIGVSFYSIDMANDLDEIEPFKTAINVYFVRELPFVLYAVALLAAGLFIERFYCRFLCPLGGALGVMGRIHMFKWLRRKPACGTTCRICEADCPVGAIEPTGQINMNECLQCLDCQVDYYDDEKCPPLIQRKKRKDLRAETGIGTGAPFPVPAE